MDLQKLWGLENLLKIYSLLSLHTRSMRKPLSKDLRRMLFSFSFLVVVHPNKLKSFKDKMLDNQTRVFKNQMVVT